MFLSNNKLQYISNKSDIGTKISIYIPTHPTSSSSNLSEDCIRFKNALQAIEANEEYNKHELGETMKKLESLLDDLDFWKHRTIGLAVFADKDGFETIDLNYEMTDMQYVQNTFVISPLAVLLSMGTGYYVLDINHTKPRLVYFTSHSKAVVELKDMPGSYEDTVGRDEYQQHIQHQSGPRNMLHGQSESGAMDADELLYNKLIATAVDEYLVDHDEPLLLTGTENRIGHMRPLLSYNNVMKEAVVGNNQDLNEQQLQDATAAVIESVEKVNRDKHVDQVNSMSLSRLAFGSTEIEAALVDGRVETLFLSVFRQTADNVREGDREIIVLQLPEDIMTIESLVRDTLSQGGTVVAVKQGSFDTDEPRAVCRF